MRPLPVCYPSPNDSSSQAICLLMKGLTLVDAIDVEMKRSAGFAHQADVISFLRTTRGALAKITGLDGC